MTDPDSTDGRTTRADRTTNAANGTLSGKVTGPDGNGVQDANVEVLLSGAPAGLTETGPNGNYTIELSPDTYDVKVKKVGYKIAEKTGVTIESGATTRADFSLDRALRKFVGSVGEPNQVGMDVESTATSGWNYGLRSRVASEESFTPSAAIRAEATGFSDAIRASADVGQALRAATSGRTNSVISAELDHDARAIYGEVQDDGYQYFGFPKPAGVVGATQASTGNARGVIGRTDSDDGYGVVSNGQLAVKRDVAYDGDFRRHVATIENTSGDSNGDILGLKTRVGDPGAKMNFISFLDNSGQVGQIEGDGTGGIAIQGTSADVAEYFPKADPDRTFADGQVVGLRGGEAVAEVTDADAWLVVSSQPLLTGNKPLDDDGDGYVELSLVGQVPVAVSGPVTTGDELVASFEDPGTAVSRRQCEEDRPPIGLALEGHDDEGGGRTVTTLVGTGGYATNPSGSAVGDRSGRPNDGGRSGRPDREDERIADLERENERLSTENERLREDNERLRDRVAAIEAHLGLDGTALTRADD